MEWDRGFGFGFVMYGSFGLARRLDGLFLLLGRAFTNTSTVVGAPFFLQKYRSQQNEQTFVISAYSICNVTVGAR